MKKVVKKLTGSIILVAIMIGCDKSELKQPDTVAVKKESGIYDFRQDQKLIQACNPYKENLNLAGKAYANVDTSVIYAIYAITPGSNRIAAFSVLTPQEKYAYWDNLISIKTENQGFTQDQKNLLNSFRTLFITPTLYSEGTDGDNARAALEGALDNIVAQFYSGGITTSQLLNTLESTSLGNSNNIPYNTVNGGNTPDCSCNKGSIVNTLKMQECGEICAVRGSGCGVAGAFSCNGRPYNIGPNNTKEYLDTP